LGAIEGKKHIETLSHAQFAKNVGAKTHKDELEQGSTNLLLSFWHMAGWICGIKTGASKVNMSIPKNPNIERN